MHGERLRPRDGRDLPHGGERRDTSARTVVRILQAHQRGTRYVRRRRTYRGRQRGGIHDRVPGDRAHLHAGECRRPSHLVMQDVRTGVEQDLGAWTREEPHRGLVGHRPAGEKERRVLPQQLGDALLQAPGGGIAVEDVVAHLRLRHRASHRRRGLRHRGASHVNAHWRTMRASVVTGKRPTKTRPALLERAASFFAAPVCRRRYGLTSTVGRLTTSVSVVVPTSTSGVRTVSVVVPTVGRSTSYSPSAVFLQPASVIAVAASATIAYVRTIILRGACVFG